MQLTANDEAITTEAVEAKLTPASAKAAGRLNVLAIDDSEEFCHVVRELLEPHGYAVFAFANPVKALEYYTREKENIDLVLLDFYMPGLDGVKTSEWLRKLNPNVKVIICSGADELRLRQFQAQRLIDLYIHKPFRVPEALHVINQIMGKVKRP